MALTKITDKQVTYKQGSSGSVVRNLGEKLRESVSVKDFGAVGDGVTDDTRSLNYCSGGFNSSTHQWCSWNHFLCKGERDRQYRMDRKITVKLPPTPLFRGALAAKLVQFAELQ